MRRNNISVREFFHVHNQIEEDIDLSVDGADCFIAVCFGEIKLTKEGERVFGDMLNSLRMSGYCIVSDNNADYDEYERYEMGKLTLAKDFLLALAGYCSSSNYEKWFEGDDAELL